jgi:lipopolysaccharide transport system ATP-binding protein
MNSNTVIEVHNVSKQYALGSTNPDTLRDKFVSIFNKPTSEQFNALDDVSFNIEKGQVTGIIGRNGAGKSTILKLISRITYPTRGYIDIRGNVASLLEVGTGFHPELTGRENVYLNGSILGMSRVDIRKRFDEIVMFSGIGSFIDTPVKHYSSGMYVRLAFAVAAHLEPEILIIDEVLAVGDMEFQKKCLGRMKEVGEEGRTVLFVSHNIDAVRTLCERGIVLHKGQKVYDGPVDSAIQSYMQANALNRGALEWTRDEPYVNGQLALHRISLIPESGDEQVLLGEAFRLEFDFERLDSSEKDLHVTIQISTVDGTMLFNSSSVYVDANDVSSKAERFLATCSFPPNLLNEGAFAVAKLVVFDDASNVLFEAQHCYTFEVQFNPASVFGLKGRRIGPIKPLLKWSITGI